MVAGKKIGKKAATFFPALETAISRVKHSKKNDPQAESRSVMNRNISISNPIKKSNSVSPKKHINTYSIEDISSLFEARGIDYQRVGSEINADIDRIGHRSYKINPRKGMFFNTNNENDKGPIAKLLKRLSVENPATLATGSRSSDSDSRQKQVEINQIIRNSISFEKSNEDVKTAVERYFQGRGLPCLLPAETRISVVSQGFDLIVPLFSFPVVDAKAPAPAIHITCLTREGEKRAQDWLDGNHRATRGRLKDRKGFHVYNSIAGAQERLNVNGIGWIGIGEGLETVISGRVLTGWSSAFAQSTSGLTAFLENPVIVERFQADRIGLAIFVDRDISGAGQKASAMLARKAKESRIPVLFLVPPSSIKGNKKGADWNDAVQELGIDGAKGAMQYAISRSEAELLKIEGGQIVSIENVRDSTETPREYDRIPADQAFLETRKEIKNFLDNKEKTAGLIHVDMGVGKSHALAELSRDHKYIGDPVLIVNATKELSRESSSKSGGLFREGRSENENAKGFCIFYPEVKPFSEKWRSIVAHKCANCEFGLNAMNEIRGEVVEGESCSYILHTNETRVTPVVTTTAAMLEGDKNIGKVKTGETVIQRKIVLDDTSELSQHRYIHLGHVGEWIRAGKNAINIDRRQIEKGEKDDKGEDRGKRILETEKLLIWLQRLAKMLAENHGEEQSKVASEGWKEFSELVKSSSLKWMDGVSAEMIYRDMERNLEIPVRALKDLGEAFSRGTVWIKKGILHFSNGTQALDALKKGALVLDATAGIAVRHIVEAGDGKITEIRSKQDSLKVRLVVSGNHGKTACSPGSPSFLREKDHFLGQIRSLSEKWGAENIAVLSHKSFIDELEKNLDVDAGHWGLDERGHNRWERKKALLVWGIQQLSPSVAERHYMSDRQAVIEAGGPAWPIWDSAREEKFYQIPGQQKELWAVGYKNDFIDNWNREWVTAKLTQAIGRLRATRRDEELEVIVHASFPFTESFGLEFSSVEKPDWRTMSEYQDGRKSEQIEKGIIAFHATGKKGRRTVNEFLKSIGITGISNNDWAEIKEVASGLQHEYSLFPSKTTPDLFGKDIEILIETIGNLVNFAKKEGLSLQELVETGLVDTTYEEKIALMILRKSISGDLMVEHDKKQEAS